jgi:autotransporter adhesin
VEGTDAVNMNQFDAHRAQVGLEFERQDGRIDRISAMAVAMATMTGSAAGNPNKNRLAIGVGNHGGANALSVGYQQAFNERVTVTLGGAFSGSESSAGGGISIGW